MSDIESKDTRALAEVVKDRDAAELAADKAATAMQVAKYA